MKIIIAGAGKIGGTIAERLNEEGHDITVIDTDPVTVSRLADDLDVICLLGNAANPEILKEAGAEHAELVIAATEKDEVNMVCGVSAQRLGAGHVIARIRDPQYLHQEAFLRDTLGLDKVVNPEHACAAEIARILRFPGASYVNPFSQGSVEIVEYQVPQDGKLQGLKVRELSGVSKAKVLIGVVERGGNVLIPNGDTVLQAGDVLSITGHSRQLRSFFQAIGQYRRPVRRVMIMGGGRTSVYLARLLDESGISVTVVEKDRERCDALCDLIPNAHIVCGDATHSDVLSEEGIATADAFVSLSGDDGDNIITSLYAQSCEVGKIVTKINREHFREILNHSGLNSVVSPKEIVAQQLTRFVRAIDNSSGSNMEMLYRLCEGKVEAGEFVVQENAMCIGIPLRKLRIRPNILIAALIRNGEYILPDGDTEIRPGDHAIVIQTAGRLRNLDEILEGGI